MTTRAATSCDECQDTPGFRRSAHDPRRLEKCPCRRQARAADGVPREFHEASVATYRVQVCNRVAVKAAKAFAAAAAGDLLLVGGVGSGKTALACSLLNDHYRETGVGLFVRVPKMLLDLQLLFGSQTPEERLEERQHLERLYSVPWLVLDDLGVEKGSDYTRRTLYTIYEERFDRGHRTIWTSNLNLSAITEFLQDDRISSRLAGRADVVFLACPDQREQLKLREERDAD